MNDDELLARLKAADPASDAPEPDIDRLLEATVSTDTDTRPTPGKASRRWLPAVAAGVLVLATAGLVWGIAGQDDQQPIADPCGGNHKLNAKHNTGQPAPRPASSS